MHKLVLTIIVLLILLLPFLLLNEKTETMQPTPTDKTGACCLTDNGRVS